MGNKNMREQKKKKRERDSKKKVLKRREVLRKRIKYDKIIDMDVKVNNEKLKPIINPEKQALRAQKHIEHNAEILKKLEEEYEVEQKRRTEINEKLEGEGHKTLKEKMDALGKEAKALAEDGKLDLSILDNN